MKQIRTSATFISVMLLASMLNACGSGSDNGYCLASFKGGSSEASNVCTGGCTITSEHDSNDDNASSYTRIVFQPGGGQANLRASAPGTLEVPSTNSAGALMRFPGESFPNVGVTFSFYNNGVSVATGSGGGIRVNGRLDGAGNDTYYGDASSTVTFDAVEAVVTLSGNSEVEEVRVYEICGAK